jgi:hypothetical protein
MQQATLITLDSLLEIVIILRPSEAKDQLSYPERDRIRVILSPTATQFAYDDCRGYYSGSIIPVRKAKRFD